MGSEIGSKLRAARVKKGLSQADLAEKVGVSQAAIGQWERGQYVPRGRNVNALNDVLDSNFQFDENEISEELTKAIAPGEQRIFDAQVIVRDLEIDARTLPQAQIDRIRRHPQGDPKLIFIKETVDLLSSQKIKATRTLVSGPDNRMWIIDLTTDKSVIQFVHITSYQMIERWIHSALWRLVVLRQLLTEEKNFVLVVCEHSSTPLGDDNEDLLEWRIHGRDSLFETTRDAQTVGIDVFLAQNPEQAAQQISTLEREK